MWAKCAACVWAVYLLAGAGLAQDAADEGTASDFTADPSPFSPVFSPKKMDVTRLGCVLTRQMPLSFELRRDTEVIWRAAPAEVRNFVGLDRARCEWNGTTNQRTPLPDGAYTIEARTCVRFNWRLGDPQAGEAGVLLNPHALAVDEGGNLYAGTHASRIQVFDPQGRFVRTIGPHVEGLPDLGQVCAMAFNSKGDLLVLRDRDLALLEPDGSRGRVLATLPGEKTRADWLDGLAVGGANRAYVACTKANRVFVFSALTGWAQGELGGPGNADGRFENLADVAVGPDGKVYVTDAPLSLGGRLQVFSPEGQFLLALKTTYRGGPIPMLQPRGIAVMPDHSIVVSEGAGGPREGAGAQRLFAHLSPDGRLLDSWGSRGSGEGQFAFVSRLISHGVHLFAADHYYNHRVVRLKTTGTVVQTYQTPPGRIIRPTGIARIAPDRYVVADGDLQRATVITSSGTVVRTWPLWTLDPRIGVGYPAGPFEGPPGQVIIGQGNTLYFADEHGALQRTVKLDAPVNWGGLLYVGGPAARPGRHPAAGPRQRPADERPADPARDERLYISDAEPTAAGHGHGGKIRVHDGHGALVETIGEGGALGFFGPIGRGKQDRLVVQRYVEVTPDRPGAVPDRTIAVSSIALDRPPKETSTAPLSDLRSRFGGTAAPFVAAGGLVLRGGSEVTAWAGDGRFLWSLGSMCEKSLWPAAMCLDGNTLLCVNDGTGHVESWTIGQDILLGSIPVAIDNTPPAVTLVGTEAMVRSADGPVELRGTIVDEHFDRYVVYYRYPQRDGKPSRWQTVRTAPYTELVPAPGARLQPRVYLLASWPVSADLRDLGIEVKVEAWDQAGNSSEDAASLAFDDDGDGWSNAEELALGTDPRAATTRGGRPEIRPEIDVLLAPYFFNHYEHTLTFEVFDLNDSPVLKKLRNPRLIVHASAGTFAGGDASDTGTTVVTATGAVRWTSPDTDDQLVAFTVTFPQQGQENVLYSATSVTFDLSVQRDDDRDWLPDRYEIAPADDVGDTAGAYALRGNPDSDGDGVLDGFDLAPRQTYGPQMWSSIYTPGMLRYETPLHFIGIGGQRSHATKRGERLSSIFIISSDVTSHDRLTGLLNKNLFNREDPNPRKRSPFAVTQLFALQKTEYDHFLRDVHYAETKLYPEYNFHYTANESRATAIVDNVDTIDGRLFRDAGIHRNYLRVSVPAYPDYADRRLTIQWRLTSRDFTSSPAEEASGRNFARMAWLVEVYDGEAMLGQDCVFSETAIGERDDQNLWQASLDLPAHEFFQRRPLYLRLTPYWLERHGWDLTCCGRKHDRTHDECPICHKPLKGRYGLRQVDRTDVVVSAVVVETPQGYVEWIGRLAPRPGKPLDYTVMKALREKAEGAFGGGRAAWPPSSVTAQFYLTVNGITYHVPVVSVRGLGRFYPSVVNWRAVTGRQRREAIQARADELNAVLDTADLVCLVANDRRELEQLYRGVRWGAAGTWWLPDTSLRGDTTDAAATPPTGPTITPPTAGPDFQVADPIEAWFDAAKHQYTVIKLCFKTYKTYEHIAEWTPLRDLYDLPVGQDFFLPATRIEDLDLARGKPIMAGRYITVTARGKGQFTITSDTVVQRPQVTYQPAGAPRPIVIRNVSDRYLEHEVEFCHPSDSRIIAEQKRLQGTRGGQFQDRLDKAILGLRAGAALATNGYMFYVCYTGEDYAGVIFYTIKMGAEVEHVAAEAKWGNRGLVKGLKVGKSAFARVNVVAVGIGVIEFGYNMYRYHTTNDLLARQTVKAQTIASIGNTAILAVEPWGGLVMSWWYVGVQTGKLLPLGGELRPWQEEVASTPWGGAVYIAQELLPNTCPEGRAREAAVYAQQAAIKRCQDLNRVYPKQATYIFVPP